MSGDMPSANQALAVVGMAFLLVAGAVTLGPFGIQGPNAGPDDSINPGSTSDTTPRATDADGKDAWTPDAATEMSSGGGDNEEDGERHGNSGDGADHDEGDKVGREVDPEDREKKQDDYDEDERGKGEGNGPPEDGPGRGPPDHAENDDRGNAND